MQIWTVGHSTRTIDAFLDVVRSARIESIADVRKLPGSRRMPWFDAERLEASLRAEGIAYHHLVGLGGRRRPAKDSPNTAWRVEAFRGYADFMETPAFEDELARLLELAARTRTAIMCSEVLWWRCHRRLLADALTARGHTVWHLLEGGTVEEHPFPPPARIVAGHLTYRSDATLLDPDG